MTDADDGADLDDDPEHRVSFEKQPPWLPLGGRGGRMTGDALFCLYQTLRQTSCIERAARVPLQGSSTGKGGEGQDHLLP